MSDGIRATNRATSVSRTEAPEVLLETARPELYRDNAFRVAELPVDAQARELSKRQVIVQQARHAGVPMPPGAGRVLPLAQSADLDVLSGAVQRLTDPERRLADELFWFWPQVIGESRSDQGLTLLKQGNIKGARDLWLYQERSSSDASTARHNLAVMAHVLALDWEYIAISRALSQREREERDFWWQDVFKRWKTLLDDEVFWSRVTARIRDLDDPRLTTGAARRMRTSLPLVLLMISAQLAVRAAERKDAAEAKRHLAIMNTSGLGQNNTEEAQRRSVDPVRERIKALCKAAEPKADADPQHADQVTAQLLDQALPLLAVLDCLLPTTNATRESMHDEVARRALACLIPFGNKTERWSVVLQLVDRILPVAAGAALRSRIEDNRKSALNNLEGSLCWFCKKKPFHSSSNVEVKLYGEVTRTPTFQGVRVQWRSGSLQVPRCTDCKTAHGRVSSFTGLGCFTGIVLGLLVGIAVGSTSAGFFVGAALFLVIGFILMQVGEQLGKAMILRSKDISPINVQKDFPPVKRMLAQGWKIGAKPPTN